MLQQFLDYTITSILECHTASTTYLAVHDDRPASTLVLKIFHQPTFSNASQERTFLQEMEKLSHLSHPHLVPILEAGIEDGQAYIVSAYMPNGSLRVRFDRAYPQRLPAQQAMTIIAQIGQGLAYLHARYLTHGHIKPEHILFDTNGRALLSDPGCAANPPVSTHDENASDSFRYLAPEQFVDKQSDFSDQYALCCVAYELLTGRPPFTLRDPQKLSEQQQYMEPTPPRQIVSSLSPTIEQAILKGLAKDPTHRHADVVALLAELQHAQAPITSSDLPLPRSKRRILPQAPPIPTRPPTSQSGTPIQQLRPSTAPKSSSSQPPVDPDSRTIQPQFQSRPDNEAEDLGKEDLLAPPSIKRTPTSHLTGRLSKAQNALPEDFDSFLEDMALEDGLESASMQSVPADQDDAADPFEELLRDMALKDEILLAINDSADATASIDQSNAELVTVTPASPAVSAEPAIPVAPVTPSSPVQLGTMRPATRSSSRQAPAVGTFKWQTTSKHTASIMMWSLVLLLMIGCLWTYTALAATSPKLSSLALLSNLSKPTPTATTDALGVLSPASTENADNTPTPTSRPRPTSTSRPRPTPTSRPTPISIINPTSAPTPTPQPTAKPTPQSTAPIGQTIWLKSTVDGDYVTANLSVADAPLFADVSQVQASAEFRVVDAGNGLIALQSVGNGDYVTAEIYTANVPLEAAATAISTWEQFQWINLGNGDIALLSKENGDYVSTWIGTANAPLYAKVSKVSTWETLKWGAAN